MSRNADGESGAKLGPHDPRYRAVVDKRFNKRFMASPDYVRLGASTEQVVSAVQEAVSEATLSSSQVHSIRLPGFVISVEIIFGMPDQKLTIRHDSGSSARPYVDGALVAIRKVSTWIGLHRGLDSVLDLQGATP